MLSLSYCDRKYIGPKRSHLAAPVVISLNYLQNPSVSKFLGVWPPRRNTSLEAHFVWHC
jgi:hypothetical protein